MNLLASIEHAYLDGGRELSKFHPLTAETLRQQNYAYQGTGGVSAGNQSYGFVPAFLDRETGVVHRACYADGQPAPIHLLEGLPAEWVVSRDASGKCIGIKHSVVAGFMRDGIFYTREQAARCVM
ncbi:MAG TPA: hypothetical protein VJ508_13460 [Saprospiraceae bacterium]|nr:hypothetical protein [Saprospiraceae bacterium]